MKYRSQFFGVSLPKTFHFKLLSITATIILAVAAVAISVHSSSSPASRAAGTAAKSGENSRVPGGKSKTSYTLAPRSLAPLAPTVTASKADALFTDVDGDLQADPGDTLKYTINIDSIGEDATGLTFTDTVDPNTAFVPGSLTATPVAVDDSYAATGNVRISVAAPGVLGNDFNGVPAATITGAPGTSANGGDVSVAADGSFTYNPPAGFEGTDTFSYTLTNAAGSNNATVSITVSGMIWFIDNNATACTTLAGGCGRLTNPFSSLSAFAGLNSGAGNNPAANDNIFVYESASDYVGPVTLLSGQRFIGQDATASLAAITGLTPPSGSDPLPATNSANATIVNITTGNAITVASGNTLRGFTGGDSTTDITGTGFGTLTISDVTLNGAGQALNLTNGTLAATFGSISSTNSGTTGISLTGVAGSLTSPTTTINNPTGIGISVGTSSATLDFGNTTSTSSGSTGVSLLTNTGAVTFGSLDISADANQRGFLATDNSNTITATGGAISTSGATAVEITRSSSTTPLSVVLTSVTSTGGTANGITLQNTSGSFTVAGNGGICASAASCTGGNIANKTGADGNTQGTGIFVNNASNVSITRMKLNDFTNYAVRGTNLTSFTMNDCFVDGVSGDNAANNEGTIIFDSLFGTSSFSGDTIKGGIGDNFRISNASGTSDVTIDGCTIRDTSIVSGNDNVLLRSTVSASITAHVTNNTFAATNGDHLQTSATEQSSMTIVATGNILSGGGGPSALGQGITISGGNATPVDGTETVRFNISNNGTAANPMTGTVQGGAININQTSGNGNWQGQVIGNFIGNAAVPCSGATQSSGIRLENHSKGAMIGIVSSNTVRQTCGPGGGISITAGDTTPSGLGNGPLNATVFSNSVIVPAGLGGPFNDDHGIVMVAGNVTNNSNQVCVNFLNNTAQGNTAVGTSGQGFRIRQRFTSTVFLPGYVGPAAGAAAVAAVRTYILGRPNTASGDPSTPNNGDVSVTVQSPPGGGFVNGGAQCTQPTVPAALAFLEESAGSKDEQLAQAAALADGGATEAKDILWTTHGASSRGADLRKISPAELSALLPAAIERWRATGISIDELMRLQAVTFEIADLPEGQLATATTTHVQIDETAAGYGWYSDVSPMEDSEFDVAVPDRELQTTEFSAAAGRMDLLTVVMRQLGAVYQQGKESLPKQLRPLMENTLSPAVRRVPDSQHIQLPSSRLRAVGKDRVGRETSPVSRARKGSERRAKTAVSKSPVSVTQVATNRSAKQASVRNSKLMNHAATRTTALTPSMLADVMLNIGTLPAGESVTITFNVTVDDPFGGAIAQVSNQGTVSGSNFADVPTDDPDVGGTADPTVTPIDLPDVSVAVSPTSVLEDGGTNLVYTFTRDGSTANAMTVNFSVGGTASFTEPDYTQTGAATFTATSGTVVIPGGSSTATVTIDPSVDTTVEPDETVDLTVTAGTGYIVGTPSSASGTITNDDTDVSVAVSPASVAEDGATNLVYTFTRAGVTTSSLTVNFSVGGTANFGVSPDDYTQTGATTFTPPTGTVTFTAGSSTATVTVDPEADTAIEADETVILTLTSGAGYNVISPSSATGTITNDDADVSVAVSPAAVAEDGATNLVYTFTRTGFTTGALTVNFSVGGTAVFGPSPDDYTQTGATTFTTTTGSVTFSPGSPTATVIVDPETDTTAESDETVIITLTAGASYNAVSPTSATGTILNDDTLVSVAVAPSSTAEGGANMVYTFSRTGPTGSALTVNFSVGGTAGFPADYSQSGATTFTPPTATVTFGVGNSTATVTVTALTDCAVEGSETVMFTVQPGSGYGVGSPSSATGTITNTPDSTLPTITCNADVVADFDAGVGGAVVTYVAPVGSDNCPGATTTQITGLPSGSTFPFGTTTNTFRVTDASGNTAECSFKVTVALTSIIGLDSVSIGGAGYVDSYDSTGGYPATKSSLANILSNGTITLTNSGKVWGNVRSTRVGVNMSGASQVTGNATAGTTVSLSGSASVGGTITNSALAPVMTLPAVAACAPFSSGSGISGTYSYNSSTGNLSLSGANIATLANGNYCFNNVTLTNSAQLKVNGPVVIRLTGTLNASGATSLTNTTSVPGNLRILSSYTGTTGVTFSNGTNAYLVIYAPTTGVSISGSAPVFGTVAGKTVSVSNSGALHYDIRLKDMWPAIWALLP